jgi:GTP-binding protein HflX
MDRKLENAVLVGIHLPKVTPADFDSSLLELTRLVTTLGYNVVGQVTQKRKTDESTVILGTGKLGELAQWTGGTGKVAALFERKLTKAQLKRLDEEAEDDADNDSDDESSDPEELKSEVLLSEADRGSASIVVVDTELSPSQIRNLESATGVKVLDRTGVIIEIFSRHARTRAARLQVEIARLTYIAPRLRETGGNDGRGSGVGGKGPGETKLELDRRKIRDRIKELKIELASIGNEHQTRRARREQEITVALVGYTNAGKSSLMRAMTGSEVLVADKLFATLDTTIRPMHPETRPKILLSDTVGFIKKLPHDLVASFKSTLDEALNASLLLYVVDASDPSFRSQLEVTKSVLNEVGATEVPSLFILNKRDRLTTIQQSELQNEYPDAVMLSTRDKDDLKMLRDKILSYFESDMIDEELLIPYTVKGIIGELREKMRVLGESYNEDGVVLKVRATPDALSQIKKRLSDNS